MPLRGQSTNPLGLHTAALYTKSTLTNLAFNLLVRNKTI